jgi:hypothetical protein
MGSRVFHLARADHNLKVAEHLAEHEEYADWAVVALFYAAHQWVHSALSGEPELVKDERHPRKHTGGPGAAQGGRGTNQLVAALYPRDVNEAYRSLHDLSRRTRYDMDRLAPDAAAYRLAKLQFTTVRQFCEHLNAGRTDIPTQRP